MDITEKIALNKAIRGYDGENQFIVSLQKQLKSSKYLIKYDNDGKVVKIFTDRQYDIVKSILE